MGGRLDTRPHSLRCPEIPPWGSPWGVRDLFLTLGGWPTRRAGPKIPTPPQLPKEGRRYLFWGEFGGEGEFINKRIFNFKWFGEAVIPD